MNSLNKYFHIKFKIGDRELSDNLISITIINSIKFIYPLFVIKFLLDSKRMSLYKLHGQESVFLDIVLSTENSNLDIETTNLKLLILKTTAPIKLSVNPVPSENDHPASANVTLYCIPSLGYKYFNTNVNKIFDNRNKKTPLEATKEILNTTGSNLSIEDSNKNEEKIEQLLIPPMTVLESIFDINSNYGIFRGPLFCHYDFVNNEICLWDLNKKIEKSEKYTVYVLALGQREDSTINESSKAKNTYFTYSDIKSKFRQNRNVIVSGYKHKYITHPLDKFYTVMERNLSEITSTHDINDDLEINNDVKNKITIHHERIGSENESFITSELSSLMSNGMIIEFNMDRNVSIRTLSQIGVPIKIMSIVPSYINYTGKYIVSTSIINLERRTNLSNTNNFIANVALKCFRSNYSLK